MQIETHKFNIDFWCILMEFRNLYSTWCWRRSFLFHYTQTCYLRAHNSLTMIFSNKTQKRRTITTYIFWPTSEEPIHLNDCLCDLAHQETYSKIPYSTDMSNVIFFQVFKTLSFDVWNQQMQWSGPGSSAGRVLQGRTWCRRTQGNASSLASRDPKLLVGREPRAPPMDPQHRIQVPGLAGLLQTGLQLDGTVEIPQHSPA